MDCPNNFVIKISSKSHSDVSNLIVNITIFADKKNNYGLDPMLTNELGEIHLTKELFKRKIKLSKESFIMDFSSDLENCKQEIEIKINSITNLNKIVSSINKYFPQEAKNLDHLISKANNNNINFKKVCEVTPIENSVINVEID
jgi:hypothetical protein